MTDEKCPHCGAALRAVRFHVGRSLCPDCRGVLPDANVALDGLVRSFLVDAAIAGEPPMVEVHPGHFVRVKEAQSAWPDHKCRAFIGENEEFDYSRLIEHDSVPSMEPGEVCHHWALKISGSEPQIRDACIIEIETDDDPEVWESLSVETLQIRIPLRYCPWCGDKLEGPK